MEVVMLIGVAGSGKTTFCKKFLPHHEHISLDNIQDHNRREEFSLIEMNLKEGKNIVIDDTNLTRRIRHNHIMRIKKHNALIVGVFFDLSIQRIQLQNSRRERKLETHILFHMKKQLEPPSYDEGFDYIQRIDDKFIL